jgi:hypothetical protein
MAEIGGEKRADRLRTRLLIVFARSKRPRNMGDSTTKQEAAESLSRRLLPQLFVTGRAGALFGDELTGVICISCDTSPWSNEKKKRKSRWKRETCERSIHLSNLGNGDRKLPVYLYSLQRAASREPRSLGALGVDCRGTGLIFFFCLVILLDEHGSRGWRGVEGDFPSPSPGMPFACARVFVLFIVIVGRSDQRGYLLLFDLFFASLPFFVVAHCLFDPRCPHKQHALYT